MKIHSLKCHSQFFYPLMLGIKTFEVRYNDRNFHVGDILLLEEYDPCTSRYTGFNISFSISYILDDPRFCKPGFVILGLSNIPLISNYGKA